MLLLLLPLTRTVPCQGDGKSSQKHQRKHPEELRAVIAITRHGDRTPKQKMKMKISFPEFLAFYNKYSPGRVGGGGGGEHVCVCVCVSVLYCVLETKYFSAHRPHLSRPVVCGQTRACLSLTATTYFPGITRKRSASGFVSTMSSLLCLCVGYFIYFFASSCRVMSCLACSGLALP